MTWRVAVWHLRLDPSRAPGDTVHMGELDSHAPAAAACSLAAAGAAYHVQACLDQVASKLGSTDTVSFSEQNSADVFLLPERKPL
jgi:hypothetical protein